MKYTMTVAEAARVLSKTERTIRNYIRLGQLSSITNGRSRYLDPEEVQELLVEHDSPRAPVTEFKSLRAQVRRLEAEMAVIRHMLDLRNESLGMTPEYATQLYATAIEQYGRPAGSYSISEFEGWAQIFSRIDETDLQTFCMYPNPEAWKVLLRLSARMVADVVGRKEYSTSLPLQSTHRLLAEGRRRLRISIFIFLENRSAVPAELRENMSIGDDLFEQLKKQRISDIR